MDLSNMELIYSKEFINEKIGELADKINKEYVGKNPIFIGVLNGVVFFYSDLLKKITLKCRCDFIRVSSYHGNQQTDDLKIFGEFKYDLKGEDIIIVDDICDTGKSLNELLNVIKNKGPKSVKIVCLVGRQVAYEDVNQVMIYALEKNEKIYYVGYGFDDNEYYRQLEDVYGLINKG